MTGPASDYTGRAINVRDTEVATDVELAGAEARLGMALGLVGRQLVTADITTAGNPTALAFKRWFTRRHFYDLRLPFGELDLATSPLLTGGAVLAPVAIANGGMTLGYTAGNLTLSHATDATMTEGAAQFLALHPFATYEVTVASWTAGAYGNMGWEFRSADGSRRIIATWSKSNGRVQTEYLLNGVSQGLTVQTIAVTGAFTLRVQFHGRAVSVWITNGGTTTYAGRLALVGLDLRNPATRAGWTAGILGRGHTDFTFAVSGAAAYLAGNGHADPRIVSYEDGSPIQAGETVWVLLTTRGVDIPDAYQGVYAYNTATGQLTATGAIFCDRGDGIMRNDTAGHLFYDRTVSRWRYLAIGHSDYPNPRGNWLATTADDLRFGINTVPVAEVDLPGAPGAALYEDMQAVRDGARWVAVASRDASVSVRMEAADLLGPWAETASAGTNETGDTIVKMGASRYVLAGTATPAFIARNYDTLASLGALTVDYDTGGSRVWPVVFPVRTAAGTRWHMISFDRTSPAGSYSYGRVARYRA